jgi:hypothetical protein
MRLVFGTPPPPAPQQVADAQWALVAELAQAAGSSYLSAEPLARQMVAELLRALRDEAATPEQ